MDLYTILSSRFFFVAFCFLRTFFQSLLDAYFVSFIIFIPLNIWMSNYVYNSRNEIHCNWSAVREKAHIRQCSCYIYFSSNALLALLKEWRTISIEIVEMYYVSTFWRSRLWLFIWFSLEQCVECVGKISLLLHEITNVFERALCLYRGFCVRHTAREILVK